MTFQVTDEWNKLSHVINALMIAVRICLRLKINIIYLIRVGYT